MSQAMPIDAPEPERLTWKQICERYPDEWIVMVDTEWLDDDCTNFEFGTTIVLGHFKSRKEASPFIKASFQRYNRIGSFWTGELRAPTSRFIFP